MRLRTHVLGIAATVVCVAVLAYLTWFQVMRGSPRDLAIFGSATVLVLLGAGRTTGWATVPRPSWSGWPQVVVGAGVVLAVVLSLVPRFGVVATVVVGALGVLALVLSWGPDDRLDEAAAAVPPARRAPLARSAAAWVLVLVALGVWQLVSYGPGPTLSDLVDPWMDDLGSRALLVVGWLAGLVGLLRYAWRRPAQAEEAP